MDILVKTFDQLTINELHDLLQLRSQVFVVEQDCVYQDIDGKDKKALHVIGYKDDKVVAYTRCFKAGVYFEEASIGRVVVDEAYRKFKYGHDVMEASVLAIKEQYQTETIKLSAQVYLTRFYESHRFKQVGERYLEDGIPHIAMLKN